MLNISGEVSLLLKSSNPFVSIAQPTPLQADLSSGTLYVTIQSLRNGLVAHFNISGIPDRLIPEAKYYLQQIPAYVHHAVLPLIVNRFHQDMCQAPSKMAKEIYGETILLKLGRKTYDDEGSRDIIDIVSSPQAFYQFIEQEVGKNKIGLALSTLKSLLLGKAEPVSYRASVLRIDNSGKSRLESACNTLAKLPTLMKKVNENHFSDLVALELFISHDSAIIIKRNE